jgi:hypothetical protein
LGILPVLSAKVSVLLFSSGEDVLVEYVGQVAVGKYKLKLGVLLYCKVDLPTDIRESFKRKNTRDRIYPEEHFMLLGTCCVSESEKMRSELTDLLPSVRRARLCQLAA